ncbi:MAG: SprT-like domain-containing protein [Pseudomonadota bacterium]
MTESEVLALVERSMARARHLFGEAVGVAPEVRMDLRGQSAGQASGGALIRLNRGLLDDNPQHWPATVIHELAHIITWRLHPRSQAHGWQWRRINRALGGVDQVCHQMDTRAHRVRTLDYFAYRTAGGGCVWLSSIRHRRAQKNLRRLGTTGYQTAGGEPILYWIGESRRGAPPAPLPHHGPADPHGP